MFVSSTLRVFALSFFRFAVFLCRSVFALLCLLLRCPVHASLLRILFFLSFVASECRLPLLFFSCRVPVHLCIFFSLGVLYISLPSLPPPCVSPLWSFIPLSWGFLFFFFFAVGSGMLFYTLCSPFFAAVARPCLSSGFPVSLDCSVLLRFH